MGCSRDLISRIENDRCHNVTAGRLQEVVEQVGGYLRIEVSWHGEQLPRLLDARHAYLQNEMAARLRRWGWRPEPEVSFNHFGDRGRVDILAFHPSSRCLVVTEVKPDIADVQHTLGRLDVKVRLGREIAARFDWAPQRIIPMLVLERGTSQRRHVQAHAALFGRFVEGHAAAAWLRRPAADAPSGLLLYVDAGPRRTAG